MKSNKLASLILVFVFIGLAAFFLKPNNNVTRKYIPRDSKENYLTQGIGGAAEWLYNMRKDPTTGIIDPSLVLKVRQDEEYFAKNSAKGTTLDWVEVGPDNIAGRVRALLVDKDNSNLLFAGGISGGLWKSTNKGNSWTKVSDAFDFINISCIAQNSEGDIFFGTGEYFMPYGGVANGNSGFIGYGIWKSTDRGANWTHLASTTPSSQNSYTEKWTFVNRISIDLNTDRIYAATNKGLMVSDDDGTTWTNHHRLGLNPLETPIIDVKVASDGFVIYVENVSNTNECRVYKSANGNIGTFSKITSGLPTACRRIEVAIAPTDPNYIYCMAADVEGYLEGVYRSTDKGTTWAQISPSGKQGSSFLVFGDVASSYGSSYGQGFYDNTIAVYPNNKDKVLIGGIELWEGKKVAETGYFQWDIKSMSTAKPFQSAFKYYVHADKHAIVFDPKDTATIYIGSDGGVSKSSDGGNTYIDINRCLNVTQFYTVACNDKGYVMGGTQDNGSLLINHKFNTPKYAIDVSGGDGGYCAFSEINPDYYFTSVYYGTTYRSQFFDYDFYDEAKSQYNTTKFSSTGGGAFVTPMVLWEKIDNGIAIDTSFFIGLSGGVSMTKEALISERDVKFYTVASFSDQVQTMAISKDGDNLFVGTVYGQVFRISNLLAVKDSVTGDCYYSNGYLVKNVGIAYFPGRSVTSIAVDQNNANNIVVTLGNYGQTNYVYRSTNALSGTPTFTSIQNSLPAMPVYASLIDKKNSYILIGTEYGVYHSEDDGATWIKSEGIPNIPVFMITQQKGQYNYDIFIATHGRGIFKTSSLVGINEQENKTDKFNLTVYPNPIKDNGYVTYNLNSKSDVAVNIYDLGGKLVKSYNYEQQSAGLQKINIEAGSLSKGTYIINIKTKDINTNKKFIVID